MRLGLFMMPVHPPERPLADTLAEDTAKALLADRLGFDELWVGEHFSASSEPIASPLMFMASLLPQTQHLTFCSGVLNLPNRHPAVVAAEVALFDHLSRGRFIFGIGPGGLASDFELFGNTDERTRGRKVNEAIDIIQRIWAQDPPYDIVGEFWNVRIAQSVYEPLGIGVMPKPFQRPAPPICISATSPNSSSVRMAAVRGWGPVSANIIPARSVKSHWDTYASGCAEAGRPLSGANWRVARNICIAPTDSEAEERVFGDQGSNHYYFSYMREVLSRGNHLVAIKPRLDMTDEQTTVRAITEACVIYGSPRTVLEKLIAFRDEVGPFGQLLMTGLDWGGPNAAWESQSMELLANEVMPRLRRHAGSRDEAG